MAALNFDDALDSIMREYDPNLELKEMQCCVLKKLWDGDKFIIVCLPTGYGKSLIYHVCGKLLMTGQRTSTSTTIVIAPLTVIQRDQLTQLTEKKISAARLDMSGRLEFADGTQKAMDDTILAEIEDGKYQLIFAHPEALLNTESGLAHLNSRRFRSSIASVVIDECHTIATWGKEFRTAFQKLNQLPSFFECPFIALTATLTAEMVANLPKQLGMQNASVVSENPDKANIFLGRELKPGSRNVFECSRAVYRPELERLKQEGAAYPVTLCYMPLAWCANAQKLATHLFGKPDLYTTLYAFFFSTQDKEVLAHITEQLKMSVPRIRLVFCTPALGMSFDSPCITRVIHVKPPLSVIEFVQETGRAGRLGQESQSVLHYNANDIAHNTGIDQYMREFCQTQSCLRHVLLKAFGSHEPKQMQACKCCVNCAKICNCHLCSKT